MDLQNKKILTLSECCEYLGYSRKTVYKLTSLKVLPFSKPNGGKLFFEREKLEAWILGQPHHNNSNSNNQQTILS